MSADEWDARYAASTRLFSVAADASLVELVDLLEPGTALDVGAGEGRNSLWLAARGWTVTAADISAVALNRLSDAARGQGLGVQTQVRDAVLDVAAGATYDLVVVANLHVEPGARAQLFVGAAAAVAPGGHLFVVGHHVGSLGIAGPPDAARLYVEADVEGAFPGLHIDEMRRRTDAASDTGDVGVDLVVWAHRP